MDGMRVATPLHGISKVSQVELILDYSFAQRVGQCGTIDGMTKIECDKIISGIFSESRFDGGEVVSGNQTVGIESYQDALFQSRLIKTSDGFVHGNFSGPAY